MANELIIKIKGDASDFKKAVDKSVSDAKKTFKGIGDELGKELKRVETVGTTAFKGISGIIAGAVTGATALIQKGNQYNMEIESGVNALSILLGSTEKAQAMFEELREYDKISPFDLNQLIDSAKQMMAYGIETEKVIPMMKVFGDIAMGDQDKMSHLALAFAQCSATGKLLGQDLNQMINAGFNPLEFISKKTGESISELKERMSDKDGLGITVDEVTEAFIMATSEGERFYKATEKGSQTIQGQISIMQADFEAFLGEVASKFTDVFGGKIVPQLSDYLDQIIDAFHEKGFQGLVEVAGKILADMIARITETLPQVISTGVTIVNSLLDGIIQNIPALTSSAEMLIHKFVEGVHAILPRILTIAYEIIGTVMEGFIQYKALILELGIQLITTFAKGIADSMPTLAPQIVELLQYLIDLLVTNLPSLLESLITIIASLADAIVADLPQLLAGIGETVYNLMNVFLDKLPVILKAIVQIVAAILALVADAIIVALISIGQHLAEWWNNTVKPWFNNIGENIKEFFSFIGKVIELWWNTTIKPFFTNLKNKFSGWWENIKSTVTEKMESIKSDTKDKIDAIKSNVSEKVSNIKQTVVEKVTELKTSLSEKVLSIKQNITEKVSEIKTNVTNKVTEIKTNITTKVGEIVTSVVTKIKELPGKMADIGRNIVEGIWNGIGNAKAWLEGKISDLVGDITGWFKSKLGINSPSKVFAQFGEYLTEGLAVGMDNETDVLKKTATDQIRQLTDLYKEINLGTPRINLTGTPALSRQIQSLQNVTNDNGNVFNFYQTFNGAGPEAGEQMFREFQRKVRYSGGVL